jgi:mono/diheme cytochrome c family protein
MLTRMTLSGLFLLLFFGISACAGTATLSQDGADAGAQVARGQRLFTQHCASCHATTADTVIVGPSLAGIASRAAGRVPGVDAAHYLELAILEPESYSVEGFPNLMPTNFGKRLKSDELNALVVYLLTLE